MNATERWQDMIAENLSMAGVPGARQREISFTAVQAGVANAQGQPFVIPSASSITNFSQGELRATGNNMDVAMQGPGFFTVQMPDGSKGYTRDGEFMLDAQGQLVTKQGYAVLSDAGPLRFDPNNKAPITISSEGEVSQGPDIKGKMTIAEFPKPQNLTALGRGIYRNDDPNVQPQGGFNTKVRQGFMENSNVSPTLAMATMITAMRQFETNQRVMQMQGERMGKTITELSGTN